MKFLNKDQTIARLEDWELRLYCREFGDLVPISAFQCDIEEGFYYLDHLMIFLESFLPLYDYVTDFSLQNLWNYAFRFEKSHEKDPCPLILQYEGFSYIIIPYVEIPFFEESIDLLDIGTGEP